MYRLGLLSVLPQDDIGKLIALIVTAAFFGVFFVIPLRKYYIVQQKLTFPTPAATAYTIRALHSGVHAAITARKKSLALLYTFIICFCFKVMTGYAPGVLFDWHIGWTLYRIGFTSIIALDNYGWYIECMCPSLIFVHTGRIHLQCSHSCILRRWYAFWSERELEFP